MLVTHTPTTYLTYTKDFLLLLFQPISKKANRKYCIFVVIVWSDGWMDGLLAVSKDTQVVLSIL